MEPVSLDINRPSVLQNSSVGPAQVLTETNDLNLCKVGAETVEEVGAETVEEVEAGSQFTGDEKLSDKMIKSGAGSKNKQYKKMMKKVKNDPKLQELINYFKQNPNIKVTPKGPISAKDRLRTKLNGARLSRAGPKVQQAQREKENQKILKETIPEKTEEEKNAEVANAVQKQVATSIETVKEQNKQQREKLKKLQKKYGKITLDRYSQALKVLAENLGSSKTDDLNREKNIIQLYLKQNPIATDKQLDLQEDEICADEDDLKDLED